MKLYVINEIAYEYNDEVYSPSGYAEHSPIKAFRDKTNADAECADLNKKAHKNLGYVDYHNKPYPCGYYKVAEIEVADENQVTYKSARNAVQAALKAAQDAARVEFTKGATLLFTNNPDLDSFSWQQYTNYWNDGSPTYFSVRSEYPLINTVDSEEFDDDQECLMRDAVAQFVDQFASDDMEAMFGDHKEVTVYRPKPGNDPVIEVNDYTSHD